MLRLSTLGKIFSRQHFDIFFPESRMVFHAMETICMKCQILTGWLGEAKVSCILRHRGVQLILVYSWARPVILVAGIRVERECFISCVSSLSFLFMFLPCPSLFHLLYYLFNLASPFLWERHKMSHKGWCVVKCQLNQLCRQWKSD